MASAAHSSAWPAAVSPCSRPSSPPLPRRLGARRLPDGALPPAGPARPGAPRPGRRRPPTAHGSAAGAAVTGARLGCGRRQRGPRGRRPVRLPQRDVVALREWRPSRVSPCLRETSSAHSADSADSAVAAASRVLASADVSGVLRGLAADVAGTTLRGGAPCCRWPPSWVPGPASRRAATTPCAESSSPCAPWAVERPTRPRPRSPARSAQWHMPRRACRPPSSLPRRGMPCPRPCASSAPPWEATRARPAWRCPPCWRSATPLAQTSSPARRHHRRPGPPRPGAPVPSTPHLHTEGASRA